MSTEEESKFDGVLMTMIQQRSSIQGFFDGVFGFLRRKTDFFANQKKAEEIIVSACKTHYQKFTADTKEQKKEEERKKAQTQRKKKAKEMQVPKVQKMEVQQIKKTQEKKTQEKKEQPKDTKDDEPAPKGNGGRTDRYIWTQTLQALQMFIFLSPQITKKDVKILITIERLEVVVRGEKIIQGKWKGNVNTDETYWTIEDGLLDNYIGKYIHVNVDKWKNQTSWWSAPLHGQPEINTQKINPEPSKLSDLDGETRSTVEKMMFDMKQKQAGLPTSDEMQKQDKLKEFMKMHPQMDFSQCKFG